VVKDSISIPRTWINAVLTGSWPDVSSSNVVVVQFRMIFLFGEIFGSVKPAIKKPACLFRRGNTLGRRVFSDT
jgi:hypothetical protein